MLRGSSKSFRGLFRLQQVTINTTSKITANAPNTPVNMASTTTSLSAKINRRHHCFLFFSYKNGGTKIVN